MGKGTRSLETVLFLEVGKTWPGVGFRFDTSHPLILCPSYPNFRYKVRLLLSSPEMSLPIAGSSLQTNQRFYDLMILYLILD